MLRCSLVDTDGTFRRWLLPPSSWRWIITKNSIEN